MATGDAEASPTTLPLISATTDTVSAPALAQSVDDPVLSVITVGHVGERRARDGLDGAGVAPRLASDPEVHAVHATGQKGRPIVASKSTLTCRRKPRWRLLDGRLRKDFRIKSGGLGSLVRLLSSSILLTSVIQFF